MPNSAFYKQQSNNSGNTAMTHYDAYGSLYDSDRNEKFYGSIAAKMLDRIDCCSFGSILEVGCGTGILTGQLLDKFPDIKIHAIDISEGMLDIARRKFSKAGVSFYCRLSDLPRTDYDLIISNYSYHWWSKEFCADLKEFASEKCLFAFSAPAKCTDLASGNISIARAVRALADGRERVGKTAGIIIQDIIGDFAFDDIRTYSEVEHEKFSDPDEFMQTLKIRGSLLALSTAYDINENDLEIQIRKNLKNTATPAITWPTLIATTNKANG